MKHVLITGANKGIGFETARQLLEKGYFVYIGSRDEKRGEEAVEKLKAEGLKNVETLTLDVTDGESVKKAREILGNKIEVLDVLINNAGISGDSPQEALKATIENYKNVMEVNLYGVVRTTQIFMDLLKKASAPRIVNVSTSVGSLTLQSDPTWFAYDYAKYAVYGSSKAAVNMFTVHLAYELRDTNFKVNAVCPGYTKTDFTGHNGGDVQEAGRRIVKYAMIGDDGPTGKFFSEETNPETGEIPW